MSPVVNPVPVLLDTDIGSDIDDALALGYLLKQPRCELLGITTVSGDPANRAVLADVMCRAAGRTDIPVHVGAAEPFLSGSQVQPRVSHQQAVADLFAHGTFPVRNTAVEFLRDTIRARPGEITLLTIGPLTNIALLYALDPEIPSLLKQIVIMGGWFFSKSAYGNLVEWNIALDPWAAARIFRTPLPPFTAVGIDVTDECRISKDQFKKRFKPKGDALKPLDIMVQAFYTRHARMIFHDPLAAALIFEPTLCEIRQCSLDVDLTSHLALGQTVIVNRANTWSHCVASEVNVPAFFKHYFDIING